MELELKDNIVLITGSSRGIGLAIAESFLEEQAQVILTGRNKVSLIEVQKILLVKNPSFKVDIWQGDLTQEQDNSKLSSYVKKKHGMLTHLICNMGNGKSVPPLTEDVNEFRRVFDINLFSAADTVNRILPLLEISTKNNKLSCPSIIFISSICGKEVLNCPIAYAAAKASIMTYANNLSRPLGKRGVRVNVVTPGNIIFPGSTWENKIKENKKVVNTMLNKEVPLGRLGKPSDVANVVVFLASIKSSFITGANIIVDGGQVKSM